MAIFKVTTLTDQNDGVNFGGVSLRDTIEATNTRSEQDAVGIDTQVSRSMAPAEVKSSSFCTLMATLATKL